ncbi:MAG: site-specific DNA-methyltransferase [Planctomycetota bacterium]|nr:MAG: site-specific DNA-methyltransferase [Planctomycetota bacterium]
MVGGHTGLELLWAGKSDRPILVARALVEDPERSYRAPGPAAPGVTFDNRIVRGDNLHALQALQGEFAGRIRCIYIDPPFNTGQSLEHYHDGVEHSEWLGGMRDRLELARALLAADGSLFVHIDDNELGYFIVLLDEIFGRKNRLSVATFKQSSVSGPKARNPGLVSTTNFILYYAKDRAAWRPNRVYVRIPRDKRYASWIGNFSAPHSEWRLIPLRQALAARHGVEPRDLKQRFGEGGLEQAFEEFVLAEPERVVQLARVLPKDVNRAAREVLEASRIVPDRIHRSPRADLDDYYFMNGKQVLFYAAKTRLVDGRRATGQALSTLWDDLLSNNIHNEGGVRFTKGKKPEALIKRVLELSTAPGDWVLDSFAGSGTTGAVAQKMGRRWILVESGDQCETHVVPRLRSVIDGTDRSGVTQVVGWEGGGGFRFYRLAAPASAPDGR